MANAIASGASRGGAKRFSKIISSLSWDGCPYDSATLLET
jgi:hypothetical protein